MYILKGALSGIRLYILYTVYLAIYYYFRVYKLIVVVVGPPFFAYIYILTVVVWQNKKSLEGSILQMYMLRRV